VSVNAIQDNAEGCIKENQPCSKPIESIDFAIAQPYCIPYFSLRFSSSFWVSATNMISQFVGAHSGKAKIAGCIAILRSRKRQT